MVYTSQSIDAVYIFSALQTEEHLSFLYLRKKSATIICSANGSSAPTATTRSLVMKPPLPSKYRQLTNRFPRTQCLKPFWSIVLLPPRPLLLNVMEERNDVPKTTTQNLSAPPLAW